MSFKPPLRYYNQIILIILLGFIMPIFIFIPPSYGIDENSWKELLDADRRIILYNEQLNLAEKSIHLLEVEYATANKNFEEILRMERKQLFYALELERARADKQAAVSFIEYLMGK